jgi:hypothetical protein
MAKESGLGWTTLTVASNDLRNDVRSLDIATPREVQDVTGIDKSAYERLFLLADGSVDMNGVFNDAASKSHVTLKGVATASASVAVAIGVSGQTLSMNMLQTDYALSRGDDGALTWKAPFTLADGTAPAWS